MRIAITGATGFVGGHLTAQLRALNHEVIPIARAVPAIEPEIIRWSLDAEFPLGRLDGFDALIHCAWDLAATDRRNVAGSARLFEAARAARVPCVLFISSLSAFEGCRSRYGMTKLEVEKQVGAIGGCSVRLGFVCDDSGRGLSGSLKRLAALPLIPAPGGGRQVLFTIQAADLGAAFAKIVLQNPRAVVNLAHPEPVTLARVLTTFARAQGKSPILLPLPWQLLWALLRAPEAAGVQLPFRSDSLVSLMNQNATPDFSLLKDLDIHLRGFARE